MYMEDANVKQLETICLYEDCPIDLKFEAARELQMRCWKDSYLTDLVVLWGKGMTAFEIGIELGIETTKVQTMIRKYKLKRRQAI